MQQVRIGETDDQGRRRVIAQRPVRGRDLPDGWVELDDDALDSPGDLGPDDRAIPYYRDDNVEWDIERAPDIDGALDAMEDHLGRGQIRQLLRDYPDVLSAMSRGRFDRAWGGLQDAHESGDLSDDDLDALKQIAADHNVPVPEDA